jgi:hypothetical protein
MVANMRLPSHVPVIVEPVRTTCLSSRSCKLGCYQRRWRPTFSARSPHTPLAVYIHSVGGLRRTARQTTKNGFGYVHVFSSFPSQLLALTLTLRRGRNQGTPLATLSSPRPCSPAPTPYAEASPLRIPSHAARSEAPVTPRVVVNARLAATPFPAFHPAPPHPIPSLRPQFAYPC